MWCCFLFVCLGSFFVYKDLFIIHTPMEMPRNLSRGKRIFARDNNKLSFTIHRCIDQLWLHEKSLLLHQRKYSS